MTQNLPRAQQRTLVTLSTSALILAIVWFLQENKVISLSIKLDPLVALFSGAIPIFSLWWPFRPKYQSKRLSGSLTLQIAMRRSSDFGSGEARFQPSFSDNSPTSMHLITRFHPDLIGSAIAKNANRFQDIKNVGAYEISNEDKSPNLNDIIILKNRYGNYALMKITDIEKSAANISSTEIQFDYVINPAGGLNFS